jgi:hypothetical protein
MPNCFIGTTKVFTEFGLIPINQLKIADKVLTNDGSLQQIQNIYSEEFQGALKTIKIQQDYQTTRVTADHPFWIIKDGNTVPEWVLAKDVSIGDSVGFPIPTYNVDDVNYTENDCFAYGQSLLLGNVETINTTMINLPIEKSKMIIKGMIQEINNEYIIDVNSNEMLIDFVKYLLLRMGIIGNTKYKGPSELVIVVPRDQIIS